MRKTMVMFTAGLMLAQVMAAGQASAQGSSVRPAKAGEISFRAATSTPVRGFEKTTAGRATWYIAPRTVLSGGDVASTRVIEVRGGSDLVMSLSKESAGRLNRMLQKSGADHLAAYDGGNMLFIGAVSVSARDGTATVTGLTATQAGELTRVLSARPIASDGATMTVVAERAQIGSGESVVLHLFVNNAIDLRAYQTTLSIRGGSAGYLTLEDISIDTARADYIFTTRQKLEAVDRPGGRIGSVLMSGTIDVTSTAYIGTYLLRASDNASGTFYVNVDLSGRSSMLTDSKNKDLVISTGPDVLITVGAAGSSGRPTDK